MSIYRMRSLCYIAMLLFLLGVSSGCTSTRSTTPDETEQELKRLTAQLTKLIDLDYLPHSFRSTLLEHRKLLKELRKDATPEGVKKIDEALRRIQSDQKELESMLENIRENEETTNK